MAAEDTSVAPTLPNPSLPPPPVTEPSAPGGGAPLTSFVAVPSPPPHMEGPAPGGDAAPSRRITAAASCRSVSPSPPRVAEPSAPGGGAPLTSFVAAPSPPPHMEGPAPGGDAAPSRRITAAASCRSVSPSPPRVAEPPAHGHGMPLASLVAADVHWGPRRSASASPPRDMESRGSGQSTPPTVKGPTPGGGDMATVYLIQRAHIFHLLPSWTIKDFHEEGGFTLTKTARLVAVRNGVPTSPVILSQLSDDQNGNLCQETSVCEDQKVMNIVEVLVWPSQNRVCVKLYSETGEWCATGIFFMKRVTMVIEIAYFENLSDKEILEELDFTNPDEGARFLGCSYETSLEFAPLRMLMGTDIIMNSCPPLGYGAEGLVGSCSIAGRPAALKVRRNQWIGGEPREVRILAKLCHPNVLQLYWAGPGIIETSSIHICTEIYDRTLVDYLNGASSDKQDPDRIIREIMSGLQYLHNMGIVHRDIKPDNIMFDAAGGIRLLDFGHANFLSPTTRFMNKGMYGTELYAAPELEKTLDHNEKVDVYSAGIVMYELFLPNTPEAARYSKIRKMKDKAFRSTNWAVDDLEKSWNSYPFAKGWHGNVRLLKRMIKNGGRPSATEVLEILAEGMHV